MFVDHDSPRKPETNAATVASNATATAASTATASNANTAIGAPNRASTLIKKFGVVGFAFFFIKGMLWLTIPALLAFLSQ